jgi:hypothetical protein
MGFEIEERGRDYWGRCDAGEPYFIGRRLSYQGRVGLGNGFPGCPPPPIRYSSEDYAVRFGLWAALIAPSIACEGGSFTALNSYDRAAFSFGIGQFAAHVPNGDFVCFLKALLGLPDAGFYFPTLAVVGGRICEKEPLENATSTLALRNWLNPDADAVGPEELSAAARLIHWTLADEGARAAQVAQMVKGFQRTTARAAERVPGRALTGAEACIVADLVHHGRAGRFLWQRVSAALADPEPLARLLDIGGSRWASRVGTLRAEIVARPVLGQHIWDRATGSFIPTR